MSIKVASTPEFVRLARIAEMRGYNRQIDPNWIEKVLDPNGAHVLEFLIPHEHAQGREVSLHARCQVFLKVKDSVNPMQSLLDIPIDEFNALPTIDREAVAI